MRQIIFALRRNRRGATAIEYGLIAAIVVLGAFVGMNNLAGSSVTMWNNVSNTVSNSN